MSRQDDREELRDITARLVDGNRDLVGRLDERDRLRANWYPRETGTDWDYFEMTLAKCYICNAPHGSPHRFQHR